MSRECVLVTSVGGNVGQGVVKALRDAMPDLRLLGVDMHPLSAGFAMVDRACVVPRAGAPGFDAALDDLVHSEKAAAVLVCSHAELEYFSRNRERLEKSWQTSVLVNPVSAIEIGCDKLATVRFLERHGFPFPRTASCANRTEVENLIERHGWPLILKPRLGSSSRHVHQVANRAELEGLLPVVSDGVLQEFLPADKGEFTAGTVSDPQKKCRACIVLRRELLQGTTYRTEWTPNPGWERKLSTLAETLGAAGPCNFQFRLRGGEPCVFEINPRFSGTSGIRYRYGFNDAQLTLDLFLHPERFAPPTLRPAVVLRYWDEVTVRDESFASLAAHTDRFASATRNRNGETR